MARQRLSVPREIKVGLRSPAGFLLARTNEGFNIVKWLTSATSGAPAVLDRCPTTLMVNAASLLVPVTSTTHEYELPGRTARKEQGGESVATPLAASTVTVPNSIVGFSVISIEVVGPLESTS
jgi:hypothetical protein